MENMHNLFFMFCYSQYSMFSGKKYVSCVHAIKYSKGGNIFWTVSIKAYSKNLYIDIFNIEIPVYL